MQTLKSKSLPLAGDLLKNGKLGNILKKAQLLSQWQTYLVEIDPELAQHCQVANLREAELIIEVNSAAWGMRLKFLTPELLKKLNAKNPEQPCKQIRYFIHPAYQEKKIPTRVRPAMSAESAQVIAEAAADISDPVLKAALLRLARL